MKFTSHFPFSARDSVTMVVGKTPHYSVFWKRFFFDRFAAEFAELKWKFYRDFSPAGSLVQAKNFAHFAADLVGSVKFYRAILRPVPSQENKKILYPILLTHRLSVFAGPFISHAHLARLESNLAFTTQIRLFPYYVSIVYQLLN
jgi:hypothetical protein